jgi:hypothetical protein
MVQPAVHSEGKPCLSRLLGTHLADSRIHQMPNSILKAPSPCSSSTTAAQQVQALSSSDGNWHMSQLSHMLPVHVCT